MAANHTALRVERQDLFEDQLRASNTRSVRRASGLVLVVKPETMRLTGQLRRRLLSEARSVPPLIFGTTINSSTVTFDSSTCYSSSSRFASGGLKFHCWRTISRNEVPPSEDQRNTN